MTKKDYVKLANVLKTAYDNAPGQKQRDTVAGIVYNLGTVLSADNPRFNDDKFREAIFSGVEK